MRLCFTHLVYFCHNSKIVRKSKAPFTLALNPGFQIVKLVWPNHIHYVVYRKQFTKCIRGVYSAALNNLKCFEIGLK